jgi:hypothetical protein
MQGCLVLRFQPGWASGEGTAFEFLPLPSAIEAAAYDASFSGALPGFCERDRARRQFR